ncbi:MAG: peptidylprolyl isomerase [Vulcanibacillus sp.]
MRSFRKVSFLVLVLVLLFTVAGCNNNETIIAEYEGGQVTQSEFDIYMGLANFFEPGLTEYMEQSDEAERKEITKAYLETYIGEQYLAGKVEDDKSLKDKADTTLQLIKDQYTVDLGSEEAYKQNLTDLNITEDDLHDYLYRYYKAEDYFVTNRYEEDNKIFSIATVSHILIANEERTDEEAKNIAEEVLVKLKAGEDFATLVTEYSDDPGSKSNGGTYENMPVALWVEEFMEAAITLPLNEISELVQTDYGYHIIKVTERSMPTLDEVSPDVRNIIFSEEYSNFMNSELSTIITKINL